MNVREKLKQYINLIEDRYVHDKFTIVDQDPIYELENEILEVFGLPASFTISNTLQEAILDENGKPITVADLKGFLQEMATDYLVSKPLTDKQLLMKGKRNKTAFDDVLQYMDILPHRYCVFIYEELYCKNIINEQEAINALHKYAGTDDTYINSFITSNGDFDLKIDFAAYNILCQSGFPYLNEFVQYEISIQSRTKADNKHWDVLFKKKEKFSKEFELSHFFITRLECHKTDDTIFLDTIFEDNYFHWYAVVIICDKAILEIILSNSKYGIQAANVRSNLTNGVKILNLKRDSTFSQIEIIGLKLQLEAEYSDEENPLDGYFTVKSFSTYTADDLQENINQVTIKDDLPF